MFCFLFFLFFTRNKKNCLKLHYKKTMENRAMSITESQKLGEKQNDVAASHVRPSVLWPALAYNFIWRRIHKSVNWQIRKALWTWPGFGPVFFLASTCSFKWLAIYNFSQIRTSEFHFLRGRERERASMPVVIESSVWEPNPWLFILIFLACFLSILLFPYFSKKHSVSSGKSPAIFDLGIASASFLRFQRNFLIIYFLASGPYTILYIHVFDFPRIFKSVVRRLFGCRENVGNVESDLSARNLIYELNWASQMNGKADFWDLGNLDKRRKF